MRSLGAELVAASTPTLAPAERASFRNRSTPAPAKSRPGSAGRAAGACAWLLELSGQGTRKYHVKYRCNQDVFSLGILCICLTRDKHTADRDWTGFDQLCQHGQGVQHSTVTAQHSKHAMSIIVNFLMYTGSK